MSGEATRSDAVPGRVVDERVLAPGEYWAKAMPSGAMLRIVDLEGKQAVDFLCSNAQDPSERYSAADTMKYAGTIVLTKGHGIYSDMGRPLFTIVEDTCGRHDTIGGCCSAESNLSFGTRSKTPPIAVTTSCTHWRRLASARRTSWPTLISS